MLRKINKLSLLIAVLGAISCSSSDEENPCDLVDCVASEMCELDDDGEAVCVPLPTDDVNPCDLVDCVASETCELDDDGEAVCVPLSTED